jgi:hypothetical protein
VPLKLNTWWLQAAVAEAEQTVVTMVLVLAVQAVSELHLAFQ